MAENDGAPWLQRPIEPGRDHVRGGDTQEPTVSLVIYADYLCPFCRKLRQVLLKLRRTLGERFIYVFRHFPNERVHPGANLVSRAAEAAGRQGRFWDMHDAIYDKELPVTAEHVREIAQKLGLDMERFEHDLADDAIAARVDEDIVEGKRNGVTGTPTLFIDGMRYDGAWDFYSLLEELQQPVAARLQRGARVFASLPAAGGLVLLIAAALALLCANTPLAPYYGAFVGTAIGIGPPGSLLSMPVGAWFSEGLLSFFFLLVGLEIRREMTSGSLSEFKVAALPAIAACGGVLAPTAIYLALNRGLTAPGWSVPTATDIAFALGVLALFGPRVPPGLRVFVAALAVVDDILSVVTLAIFYPHNFTPTWLIVSAAMIGALYALNRARVYPSWPYIIVTLLLWLSLHAAGVHGALSGIFLAAFLPTRPTPDATPLLAQAATALAALDHAEHEAKKRGGSIRDVEQEPIWDWAGRNLSAASERLISPADRIERAMAPWSSYVILPLFAFAATGISFDVDFSAPGATSILTGVILGLVIGKPLGIAIASYLAIKARIARAPDDVTLRGFIGAACLCGIGDTVSLLMADQAFPHGPYSATAKIGVLCGSILAAALGSAILAFRPVEAKTKTAQAAA